MEQPQNPEKNPAHLEIKEGEPKVHTVYAYIKAGESGGGWRNRLDVVKALYVHKEDILALGRADVKRLPEENVIVPLHVYEREEDLPEAIRKQIHSQNQEHGPSLPTFEKKEGVVYAILPNTEVTEGKGENFIWALVTDPELANKIAWGNGVSGSNPYVIEIPLNKPIKARNPNHPDISMSPIVIRRDSKTDALTDELFA